MPSYLACGSRFFGGLIIFFLVVEPEGPEPAVAEYPELLSGLAIFLPGLRSQQRRAKMQYLTKRALTLAGCVAAGMWLAGGADAQQKQILIGSQCDRPGPTQLVGTVFCPGVQDYVNLVNSAGRC